MVNLLGIFKIEVTLMSLQQFLKKLQTMNLIITSQRVETKILRKKIQFQVDKLRIPYKSIEQMKQGTLYQIILNLGLPSEPI